MCYYINSMHMLCACAACNQGLAMERAGQHTVHGQAQASVPPASWTAAAGQAAAGFHTTSYSMQPAALQVAATSVFTLCRCLAVKSCQVQSSACCVVCLVVKVGACLMHLRHVQFLHAYQSIHSLVISHS